MVYGGKARSIVRKPINKIAEERIIMSDTMIAALIGAGVTLIVTVVTLITNAFIEKYKSKLEIQQKEHQIKRENLNEVYTKLISIINLYPNSSPNDVMNCIEYSPNYFMESFDSVIKSLDYQIEDYKEHLKNSNIDYERKNNIEVQISNREYAKKKIREIRDEYFNAQDKYKSFCESEKVFLDLYAGQNVRNCLVEFEVMIHNVFISGGRVGETDDPINNCIEFCRRNLIGSMRYDIGII